MAVCDFLQHGEEFLKCQDTPDISEERTLHRFVPKLKSLLNFNVFNYLENHFPAQVLAQLMLFKQMINVQRERSKSWKLYF
jgi:hypothetical protein